MSKLPCQVCKQQFNSHWQSSTMNAIYCLINDDTKWALAQPNTTYIPDIKSWLCVDFDLTKSIPRQKLADKWNVYNPTYQMTSNSVDEIVCHIDKERNQ